MKLDAKSLTHLFKIRNDQERWQKYDQNTISMRLFNETPLFPIYSRAKFQTDLSASRNLKSALDGIGYNYSYDKSVLTKLIEEGSKDSELPIIIACFQFISLFYYTSSNEGEEKRISTDDFSLFMQILNFDFIEDIQVEINFLFRSLLDISLQTKDFIWTKDNINLVFTQFDQNLSLPSTFFPLFCNFTSVILNLNRKDYHPFVIDFLVLAFKQKRELFETDRLFELINFIKPSILELDPKALYILSEISKRIDYDVSPKVSIDPHQSLNEIIIQIAELFDKKTAEQSEKFSLSSETAEDSNIHELPDLFVSKEINNYKFDFQIFKEKLFQNDEIYNLPKEIIQTENFALFERFSPDMFENIDTFARFVENMDHKWSICFLDKLIHSLIEIKKRGEVNYQLIAAFLLLLKKLITDGSFNIDLSKYLPFLFDEEQVNQILYKPKNSVFGPQRLDPLLNDFRSAIIELLAFKNGKKINPKNRICLFRLLKNQINHPFLITETLSRLICKIPVDELLDSSEIINNDTSTLLVSNDGNNNLTIVDNENVFKGPFSLKNDLLLIVSKTALSLRNLKAPIESRNAITTVIFELLQNRSSFYSCLTMKPFVDCLFAFVFENGLSQLFLTTIYKSLLLIGKDNKISPLDHLVNLMYQSTQAVVALENKNNEKVDDFIINIKEKIFEIVSFTARLCPRLAKLYDKFVIPMLYDVDNVNKMNGVIYMLITYSSKRNFELDMTIFNLLVEKVRFLKFIHVINLIGMSPSLSSKSIFMIRRPCFLPLLFIMFNREEQNDDDLNKNIRFREDVIETLKELATFSEYNRRALHDGKIDSILLSYINNEDPIYVNGVRIHLDYQDKLLKKDALYLLNLIIPAKSSNEVVSHVINILTSPKHEVSDISDTFDIFSELYKIVSKSINHPRPSFDIGNIKAFCYANNIDPLYFKDTTFTISFMMKQDPLLLNKSTSQVMVVSLFDHSKRRFSIVLMNNGIYASYEANNSNTVVPLVQRSNPNEWAFYTFIFVCKRTQNGNSYIITSYKNLERQHDSEFCSIKFDNTPDLTLLLGGYSYNSRKLRFYFERCASIANLSIMAGAPKTREDIVDILLQNRKTPKSYIFTTNYFGPKLTNRTEKMTFNGKEMDVQFSRNIYENTTVETFLPNYCKKLINSFKTIDQNLFKYIIPLLSFSFQKLKSAKLINSFASILMSDQVSAENLNMVFYKSLFEILFVLHNNEKVILNTKITSKRKNKSNTPTNSYLITDCWSKSIVFNFDIWKKSPEISQILEFISTSMANHYVQNLFSNQPEFFCYFLKHLSQIIEKEDDNDENKEIIERFIFFLSRVAYVQLEKDDCTRLFSLVSQIETKEKLYYYLKLIRNIAQPISKCGFKGLKDFSTIYSKIEVFSSSENEERDNTDQIHIVIDLILVLHELYGADFHTKVVKIIKAISLSSSVFIKKLFTNLEILIDDYPNLFSLTTLIAFVYRIILNAGITKIPQKEKFSQSNLWFVFPSLLAIVNYTPTMLDHTSKEDNTNIKQSKLLFDFIVDNSIAGNSIDTVSNFINVCSKKNVTQNIEIKLDKDGYLIDSPLYYYLSCLINKIFEEQIEDKDIIFNVYFNSVAFLFYHLDAKLIPKDRTDLDPMSYFELLYKNKNNFQESFKYHPCMNENDNLYNIELFNQAIQLALKHFNIYGNTEKSTDKKQRSNLISIGMGLINGESSKPTRSSFNIQEINEILLYFKSKSEKQKIQQFSMERYKTMNSIFEWMLDTIKEKFRKDFNETSDLITSHLFYEIIQKYPFIDKSIWIDYVKNSDENEEQQQQREIKSDENEQEKENQLELLPILNYCYCPFLCYNTKSNDMKEEDEEINNFFEGIHYVENNDKNNFVPNAYNILFGRKIPIVFRIEQEGVYLNNQYVPFQYFKFVISMNREQSKNSSSNNNSNNEDSLIDNSILFILTNGISFLLQFVETSNYFIQLIKKQHLPPHCFIAHSKDEMIEFLKPICIAWQSSMFSTFDFLNVLNLMDGRTYLACKPGSKQITNRHLPIFPSIEFIKYYSDQPEKSKQLFSNPEIYYLIDEYPDAYENRKLLEKSAIIHEFVEIAFPDFFANKGMPNQANSAQQNSSQSSANIVLNPRKPLDIRQVSVQKIDITTALKPSNDSPIKFSKDLIFISKLNIPNMPSIFAFIFSNGPVVFGQISFDKFDKLCFDPIIIKSVSTKGVTNDGKNYIAALSTKHGFLLKYAKTLKFAEIDRGFIFYDKVSLRTITIKHFSSSPVSIPSASSTAAAATTTTTGQNLTVSASSHPASEPPNKAKSGNIHLSIQLPDAAQSIFHTSALSPPTSSSNLDLNSSQNFIQVQSSFSKSVAKLLVTEDVGCFIEKFMLDQTIFLRNPSTVSTGNFENLKESDVADLVFPAASIVCIEQSRRFSVLAIGCDDGRVIVHAVCPGVKVATIRTDLKSGEISELVPIPTKILFTDNCGFVLVYTSNSSLIVSTLSGTIVKSIEKFNTIVSWFCFVPVREQIDFVGFVGSKIGGDEQKVFGNNYFLCCFEAAKPEKVYCIAELPRNCQKFEVQFDKMRNAFIIASYRKDIMVIPMPDLNI